MKIDRLLGIVMLLLQKDKGDLSEKINTIKNAIRVIKDVIYFIIR